VVRAPLSVAVRDSQVFAFYAVVPDGVVRAYVVAPQPLINRNIWQMQVDHVPGLSRLETYVPPMDVVVPDDVPRRAPTIEECIEARVGCMPFGPLMAIPALPSTLPPYVVQLWQVGYSQPLSSEQYADVLAKAKGGPS